MNKFKLADSFVDNSFQTEETVLETYKEDCISEAER